MTVGAGVAGGAGAAAAGAEVLTTATDVGAAVGALGGAGALVAAEEGPLGAVPLLHAAMTRPDPVPAAIWIKARLLTATIPALRVILATLSTRRWPRNQRGPQTRWVARLAECLRMR